jgi:hypothetical protein
MAYYKHATPSPPCLLFYLFTCPTCRFAYCPSAPWVQGAMLLALPKQKVYKGAPNFVYAVFSSDQIQAALPEAAQLELAAANIRQCQPAVPQQGSDVQAGIVAFVCEVRAWSYYLVQQLAGIITDENNNFCHHAHVVSTQPVSPAMLSSCYCSGAPYFDACTTPCAYYHTRYCLLTTLCCLGLCCCCCSSKPQVLVTPWYPRPCPASSF